MKKILSLDGGGIRGILAASVLEDIEYATGCDVASQFDLIVGTSTGSMLACGATVDIGNNGEPDYTSANLFDMYGDLGESIFHRTKTRKLQSMFGISDEKYSNAGLVSVLNKLFGSYKLSDALTNVMVTSYDTNSREAVLFKSWDNRYKDIRMVDCVLASTAAPTYFEPHRYKFAEKEMCLIDGGVYANNPVLCAIAEARNLWPDEEIKVLSIGTGYVQQPITYNQAKDFGVFGWARPLLDIVFDGQTHTASYVSEKLSDTFMRIDFDLALHNCSEAMDDVSPDNIHALRRAAATCGMNNFPELCKFLGV